MQEGEKAGIIGINGTGKSTLLKMIAGLEEPDEGKIITANHCMIRFLPQNPQFDDEETVLEAVLRGNRTESNAGYIEADAKSMLTKLGSRSSDSPAGSFPADSASVWRWCPCCCLRRRFLCWMSRRTIWTM